MLHYLLQYMIDLVGVGSIWSGRSFNIDANDHGHDDGGRYRVCCYWWLAVVGDG